MGKRTALLRGAAVFCAIILVASPAHANFLIGIIGGTWLVMLWALIPIIIVETVVLVVMGGRIWGSLGAMVMGNLLSTAAGYLLMIVVEEKGAEFWESSSREKLKIRDLLYPVRWGLFIVVCFLLSWWIEAAVAGWFLNDLTPKVVSDNVFYANAVSYSGFSLWLVALFVWHAVFHQDTTFTPDYDYDAVVAARRLRKLMYRDELLRQRHGRPVHDADLLAVWRRGNRQAKQGIAVLASVESSIPHRISVNNANLDIDKAKTKPNRAA